MTAKTTICVPMHISSSIAPTTKMHVAIPKLCFRCRGTFWQCQNSRQRAAIWSITFPPVVVVVSLFKKYRILKLPHILQLQELKFYHKYINKKLPAYLQSIPLTQNKSFHEHLTRSHLKLHITRTNHRFAERCIRNSIPLLVNTMPMGIINKISTHSLQNVAIRIKEYYLSSYKERCDILNCYVDPCQI